MIYLFIYLMDEGRELVIIKMTCLKMYALNKKIFKTLSNENHLCLFLRNVNLNDTMMS